MAMDIGKAHVTATEMKGQIYNVGLSDANVSKKELCEKIRKHIQDFVFFEARLIS